MSDLIDRQTAIEAIAKMMPQSFTPDGSHPADKEIFIAQEAFADCIKTIEILPSAQPERIKGHWIEHDDGLVACECSVCHEKYNLYEEDVFERNYCPNCGADMREVTP